MENSKYSLLFKHNFSFFFFQCVAHRKYKMEQSVAHFKICLSLPEQSLSCQRKEQFQAHLNLRKSVNWDMHIHDEPLTATMESLTEVLGGKKTEEHLNPWNTELPDLSRCPLIDTACKKPAQPKVLWQPQRAQRPCRFPDDQPREPLQGHFLLFGPQPRWSSSLSR